MMTRGMAIRYRQAIVKSADTLEDSDAAYVPMLYERWEPDHEYIVGKRLYHNGVLYRVLQSHFSQENWEPQDVPALYAVVLIPDPTVIPEWVQPDSTNPYMKGDKIRHNGKNWISTVDNNVWEPGVYGWDEL